MTQMVKYSSMLRITYNNRLGHPPLDIIKVVFVLVSIVQMLKLRQLCLIGQAVDDTPNEKKR